MKFVKGHAYGNDFLMVSEEAMGERDRTATAIRLCDRHTGIGADGLIVYTPNVNGARMALFNADGGRAELSGNGVRCLAAMLIQQGHPKRGVVISTDAGDKPILLSESSGSQYKFRTAMGQPQDIRLLEIDDAGSRVELVALNMGNPQCVRLGSLPAPEDFNRLGPLIEHHPEFPARTNVEFAHLEAPDRLRILIWERGVGPTASSGTGSCAAAVAAMQYGGAARDLEVISPGGSQQVEWVGAGVFLTGWAELLFEGHWMAD